MTTKELIREKIERMLDDTSMCGNLDLMTGWSIALARLHSFLDTLPDEPEQPTRGYDEAYLNEKIAKASKSWEGVDVDKFMDEIRGREPVSDCHDLEEEAVSYCFDNGLNLSTMVATDFARHFAEWVQNICVTPRK